MKIQVLSDLHREFSPYPLTPTDAEVIVLAGDVDVGTFGIEWAKALGKPVVYVAGNHEFYHQDIQRMTDELRDASAGSPVHFLENERVIIGDTRFLGCTLWTDFRLFGDHMRDACMVQARRSLNDFRIIHNGAARFTPEDSIALHEESRAWLKAELTQPFAGKTVVVTHHMPHGKCVSARYAHDSLSACFASNADELMNLADLWIFGHTHDSNDVTIGKTRLLDNPRGYSRFLDTQENKDFKHDFVVEP